MKKDEFDLLEMLYERYSSNLYLLAKYRLEDDKKAEDAVQMVYLIAATKIEILKSHDNKKVWLYQTMQNVITKENCLREILTDQVDREQYNYFFEIDDLGLIEELKDILKEREYQYVVERFVNEKKTQEIADVLGLSYSATTSFGNRVMNKVRKYMEHGKEKTERRE